MIDRPHLVVEHGECLRFELLEGHNVGEHFCVAITCESVRNLSLGLAGPQISLSSAAAGGGGD